MLVFFVCFFFLYKTIFLFKYEKLFFADYYLNGSITKQLTLYVLSKASIDNQLYLRTFYLKWIEERCAKSKD